MLKMSLKHHEHKLRYKSIFTYSPVEQHCDEPIHSVESSFYERLVGFIIVGLCYIVIILSFPVSGWFAVKKVKDNESLVIYRLGRLQKSRKKGYALTIPLVDQCKTITLTVKAFNIPPLQLMTTDGAIVELGADVRYRVINPEHCVNNVQTLDQSTRLLARTTLQNACVRRTLVEVETDSRGLASSLQDELNKVVLEWGIKVERVEASPVKVLSQPTPAFDQHKRVFGALASYFSNNSDVTGNLMNLMAKQTASDTTKDSYNNMIECTQAVTQSPDNLVAMVAPHLTSALVEQFGIYIVFNVSGDGGGTFCLDLKNGSGRAFRGSPDCDADAVITLDASDVNKLLTGELSVLPAYMSGRLQVEGDLQAARQLGSFMDKLQDGVAKATAANKHNVNVYHV